MRPCLVPTEREREPLGFTTLLAILDKRSGNCRKHVSIAKPHVAQSGCVLVSGRGGKVCGVYNFSEEDVSEKGGDQ